MLYYSIQRRQKDYKKILILNRRQFHSPLRWIDNAARQQQTLQRAVTTRRKMSKIARNVDEGDLRLGFFFFKLRKRRMGDTLRRKNVQFISISRHAIEFSEIISIDACSCGSWRRHAMGDKVDGKENEATASTSLLINFSPSSSHADCVSIKIDVNWNLIDVIDKKKRSLRYWEMRGRERSELSENSPFFLFFFLLVVARSLFEEKGEELKRNGP